MRTLDKVLLAVVGCLIVYVLFLHEKTVDNRKELEDKFEDDIQSLIIQQDLIVIDLTTKLDSTLRLVEENKQNRVVREVVVRQESVKDSLRIVGLSGDSLAHEFEQSF